MPLNSMRTSCCLSHVLASAALNPHDASVSIEQALRDDLSKMLREGVAAWALVPPCSETRVTDVPHLSMLAYGWLCVTR